MAAAVIPQGWLTTFPPSQDHRAPRSSMRTSNTGALWLGEGPPEDNINRTRKSQTASQLHPTNNMRMSSSGPPAVARSSLNSLRPSVYGTAISASKPPSSRKSIEFSERIKGQIRASLQGSHAHSIARSSSRLSKMAVQSQRVEGGTKPRSVYAIPTLADLPPAPAASASSPHLSVAGGSSRLSNTNSRKSSTVVSVKENGRYPTTVLESPVAQAPPAPGKHSDPGPSHTRRSVSLLRIADAPPREPKGLFRRLLCCISPSVRTHSLPAALPCSSESKNAGALSDSGIEASGPQVNLPLGTKHGSLLPSQAKNVGGNTPSSISLQSVSTSTKSISTQPSRNLESQVQSSTSGRPPVVSTSKSNKVHPVAL